MSERRRVLIIDDDLRNLQMLQMMLEKDGFEVATASSGLQGLRTAYESHPEAVVLDIMMPGMDGYEVCRRLRHMTNAAILIVSAKPHSEDVVMGLQAGADDYIIKPFHYQELMARLNACLRRQADTEPATVRLAQGEARLIADPTRRLVFAQDGRSVQLTPKEFELLQFLVRSGGRVVSADAILANVWGPEYVGDHQLVKQFIYRLRSKLESNPSSPEYIVTVRGEGYAFEEETKPRLKPPTGVDLTQLPSPLAPPPRARAEAEEAESRPAIAAPRTTGPLQARRRSRADGTRLAWLGRRKGTWVPAALLLLALVVSFAVVDVSAAALPGHPAYPLKTGLEDLRLALTADDGRAVRLRLDFAQTRVQEIVRLVALGRFEGLDVSAKGFEDAVHGAAQALLRRDEKGMGSTGVMVWIFQQSVAYHAATLEALRQSARPEARPALDRALAAAREESDRMARVLGARPTMALEGQAPSTSHPETPTRTALAERPDQATKISVTVAAISSTPTPGNQVSEPTGEAEEQGSEVPPQRPAEQPTAAPTERVVPTPSDAPTPVETRSAQPPAR